MKNWIRNHIGFIMTIACGTAMGVLGAYADSQKKRGDDYERAIDKCIERGKWLKTNHPEIVEEYKGADKD